MRRIILFLARGCFSLIFIISGIGQLMNWQETVDRLTFAFSEWHMHFESSLMTSTMYDLLVSSGSTIVGIATFLEIVGAFLIFIGFKVRVGAFLLLIFMLPVTVIMHPFWFSIGIEIHREVSIFLKNLSVLGALLFLLVGFQKEQAAK